jgi:hypothetical protein
MNSPKQPTIVVTIRLDEPVVSVIDRRAQEESSKRPGIRVTRAALLREAILKEFLEQN